MKKMLSMLLILSMLLGGVSAFAQDEALSSAEMDAAEVAEILEEEEELQEIFELHGEIIEIADEYVLLDTADMGHVQANLSEDTVIEGVEALEIGQIAVVMYDGMMTRSLPPQISALHIGVYAVSGVIVEVLEDSIVILSDETSEEIILTLPVSEDLSDNEELHEDEEAALLEESEEALEDEELTKESEEVAEVLPQDELAEEELLESDVPVFAAGDRIIAYTDGAMTMSLPPMMNALAIVFAPETAENETEEVMELSEDAEEIEDVQENDETVG